MQKLLFIFLLALFFTGCDGIEDTLIDQNISEFSVTNITAPSSLEYSGLNTKLITSITFSDAKSINSVWVKVGSHDASFSITYRTEMTKIGENEYSVTIPMDSLMPSTDYSIDYFYSTNAQAEKKIASHNFSYDNLQNNLAPFIENPLFYYTDESPILRDTLENEKEFIFSIKVKDENGLSDIDSVYTDFYSPNNPAAIRVILFDDGKAEHGDLSAGDGIYSLKNIFQADAFGERKFEFWARDRRKVLSNMITHIVVVK